MATTTEPKGFFEKFYAKTEEVIKLAKKPLYKQQLIRKFASAIDDCSSKEIDADLALQSKMENVETITVNELLKIKQDKEAATATKKAVMELYSEMFGEDYKAA